MKNDLVVIQCPCCGQQYMPGEIFMPKAFFGNQKEIIRKSDGTIDFYVGDDPDLNETYICDTCGSKLNIHANLSFDVEVGEEKEFDEEYVTEINKPAKIKLEETELF